MKGVNIIPLIFTTDACIYKTLGRARDPRANGTWLNKLTESNMKCLS